MLSFGRYILSAGMASLVDFALVQTLFIFPAFQSGLSFGAAIVIGALAGMSVNFSLSRRFVFAPDARPALRQMRSFFVVSISTLGLRLVVAYALVALFDLRLFAILSAWPIAAADTRLAHIGAMGLVTLYSYFAHKHISFAGGVSRWLAKTLAVR